MRMKQDNLVSEIESIFSVKHILFAILDEADEEVRILINSDNKSDARELLTNNGWKYKKDVSNDVYLYGMDHFEYFVKDGRRLTICCQLACRSTLHGEWVPLDRKINNTDLLKNVSKQTCQSDITPENMLCYLLAKGVYTQGKFENDDITRIMQCMKDIDKTILMPKLKGVFFNFSGTILELIKDNEFDHIKERLWSYSCY